MKRKVDHSAMPFTGYTTPWSTRAGHKINLHLSASRRVEEIKICRLDTPNKIMTDWPIETLETGAQHEAFSQGSYLYIEAKDLIHIDPLIAISFEFYLTRNDSTRKIVSWGKFSIEIKDQKLTAKHGNNIVSQSAILPAKTWLTLRLSNDLSGSKIQISSKDILAPFDKVIKINENLELNFKDDLILGSNRAFDAKTLNAKFSNLSLETINGPIYWQFPTLLPDGPVQSFGTRSNINLHFVNQPTFCTTSSRWDGSSFDPKYVPTHYDAIHCHDDDMTALDWPASYSLNIPENAESGIYAFEIYGSGKSEQIIFFIASNYVTAPLLFLVPTATYLAYSDEFLPPHLYPHKCQDRGHQFAVDNHLRSLYDYHNDTSGVSICSYKKPKTTIRDDYNYPLCGCPHNLPVDLHFLKFLHHNNITFDLITDHDLHEKGFDTLNGYQALMTGSHPEYMTDEMEAAIRQFVAQGGNLVYLGGNGFAGSVAIRDDLLELRRSALEAGRTWDGPVAELSLSITNQPGGFMRHRGRGEFSLTGSAISLMGFEKAIPYTRTEESYAPEINWLFDGTEQETFGNDGLVLGGAAGYEVDATDPTLGTSPDTIVIARATDFPSDFFHDPTRWYEGGESEEKNRRCAEITFRKLSSGGHIFSVGSVAWLGALPKNNDMNDVGRLTLNLLKKFSMSQTRENSQMAATQT